MDESGKAASSFRLVATLGAAGFLSGIVLVGVFVVTQPRIQRNQAEALEAAIFRVLPGASSRKSFVLRDGRLTLLESADALPSGEAVFGGYDDQGNLVGYGIPGEGPGYQDTIKLIYGYDPRQRQIVGMEVLESKETPGLGDKILKDQDFLGNFRALKVEPEVVAVKHGTRQNAYEVDTISGATISSKAVIKIINQENRRWLPLISSTSSGQSKEQP